jgi:hypothetical protein
VLVFDSERSEGLFILTKIRIKRNKRGIDDQVTGALSESSREVSINICKFLFIFEFCYIILFIIKSQASIY